MCQLFISANPELWQSRTKSLRIDGVVSSIRIENMFWDLLDEIARRDGMTVSQLITRLYHESIDAGHDLGNFTSFLRVCCTRYLSLISQGEIDRSNKPLSALDAGTILERENQRRNDTRRLN